MSIEMEVQILYCVQERVADYSFSKSKEHHRDMDGHEKQ